MKIIKRRTRHENVTRERFFEDVSLRGAGCSFPCDEKGNVDVSALPFAAQENYKGCLAGEDGVLDRGIVEYTNSYVEPAVGLCNRCKAEVHLVGFTNTCECGADYNMSGQELASRSQWGEETGESVADIMSLDYHTDRDEW